MLKKLVSHKFVLFLARTMDYRIGTNDDDKPEVPILPVEMALLSLAIRFVIVLVNFITCGFVIANILHHW